MDVILGGGPNSKLGPYLFWVAQRFQRCDAGFVFELASAAAVVLPARMFHQP
jgi:hypothetical protein